MYCASFPEQQTKLNTADSLRVRNFNKEDRKQSAATAGALAKVELKEGNLREA